MSFHYLHLFLREYTKKYTFWKQKVCKYHTFSNHKRKKTTLYAIKMYIINMAKPKTKASARGSTRKQTKTSKPAKPTLLALETLLHEAIERLGRMEARLERIENKQDSLIAPIDMLILSRLTSLQNNNSPTPPPHDIS
jgi:hypothetical protein